MRIHDMYLTWGSSQRDGGWVSGFMPDKKQLLANPSLTLVGRLRDWLWIPAWPILRPRVGQEGPEDCGISGLDIQRDLISDH